MQTADQQITITLPTTMLEQIRTRVANGEYMSESEVLQAGVQALLRSERQERFAEEARLALKEYRENGLHLTGEEVREWLGTWGTENEHGVPSRHV